MTAFIGAVVPGSGEIDWSPLRGTVEQGPGLAPGTVGTKRCRICGRTLALAMFHRGGTGADGRIGKCQRCQSNLQAWREFVHPEDVWVMNYRRRSKAADHGPTVETFTRAEVIEAYGDCCAHCPDGAFEELDHYPVAVADGGAHSLANVRPSCGKCNRKGGVEVRRRRRAHVSRKGGAGAPA